MEEYRKIASSRVRILDLLAKPEAAEIEVEFPRLGGDLFKPVDWL
jgi:hypothetical protein